MAMAGFGVPLGIILIAATTLTGFGQDRDLYNQEPVEVLRVAKADFQFVQAVAHADTAGVEKVLDADFTWTSADGAVHSRSEVLHQLPKTAILNEKDEESRVFTYGVLADVQANRGRFHVLRVWVKRFGDWKAIVYQEMISLDRPPTFTPGAGRDCDNPCKAIPFTPNTETERQVALAYSKLENSRPRPELGGVRSDGS